MKILYVAHESGEGFGGASRSLLSLIDYFQEKNEIYVFIPCATGRMYEELKRRKCEIIAGKAYWSFIHKEGSKKRWYLHKAVWLLYRKWHNRYEALKLSRYIKKNNIEIVHTNSSVIDIGVQAAKFSGRKHIWHVREFGQEDFGMYPLDGEKKFLKMMRENSWIVIAVSNAVRNKYAPKLEQNQIITIYNGIEVQKKQTHEEHATFNMLISGLVCEAKGQRIALEAVRLLLNRGMKDVHLYIAGNGQTKKLKNEFEDIEKNIHFLGRVENMANLRRKMDVELVCSRAEAFGRVTVEAMMSELPVIGSKSGGTSELIVDGETGFLFENGNVLQLAKKITYLYENRVLARDMGRRAYSHAVNNYAIDKCVKEIEKVYEKAHYVKY